MGFIIAFCKGLLSLPFVTALITVVSLAYRLDADHHDRPAAVRGFAVDAANAGHRLGAARLPVSGFDRDAAETAVVVFGFFEETGILVHRHP